MYRYTYWDLKNHTVLIKSKHYDSFKFTHLLLYGKNSITIIYSAGCECESNGHYRIQATIFYNYFFNKNHLTLMALSSLIYYTLYL